MHNPIEVIQAIAEVLDGDASLRLDAGGEGVFEHVDSIDEASGTLIVFCHDGNPYEVRVRRVTEADTATDPDGIIPPAPIMPKGDDEKDD